MTKIFAHCLQAACVRAAQGRRMDDLFSAQHGGVFPDFSREMKSEAQEAARPLRETAKAADRHGVGISP